MNLFRVFLYFRVFRVSETSIISTITSGSSWISCPSLLIKKGAGFRVGARNDTPLVWNDAGLPPAREWRCCVEANTCVCPDRKKYPGMRFFTAFRMKPLMRWGDQGHWIPRMKFTDKKIPAWVSGIFLYWIEDLLCWRWVCGPLVNNLLNIAV